MTRYVVIESTPGYMPDGEPTIIEGFAEACSHAADLADEILDMRIDGGELDPADDEARLIEGTIGIFRHNSYELNPAGEIFYVENGTALPRVIEIILSDDEED